jgi:hypothetical protein
MQNLPPQFRIAQNSAKLSAAINSGERNCAKKLESMRISDFRSGIQLQTGNGSSAGFTRFLVKILLQHLVRQKRKWLQGSRCHSQAPTHRCTPATAAIKSIAYPSPIRRILKIWSKCLNIEL